MTRSDKIIYDDNTPLVSVIVPCYNHAQWIESCIKSVAEVDYPRLELLILDDGSNDSSFECAQSAIAKYDKKFERVWIAKQKNQGITKTLNTLVRVSKGEYLVPLASDDELTVAGIEACVRHLNKMENTDSLLIINVDVVNERGTSIGRTRIDQYGCQLKNNILARDIVLFFGTPYQHQVFSRKAFDKIGGYNESLKFEDLDFALRFISLGRISVIQEKVKKYRLWRNGAHTPGLTFQDIDRSNIYKINMSSQKGMIWFLLYLKVRSKDNGVYCFVLRVLAKLHLLQLNFPWKAS